MLLTGALLQSTIFTSMSMNKKVTSICRANFGDMFSQMAPRWSLAHQTASTFPEKRGKKEKKEKKEEKNDAKVHLLLKSVPNEAAS